MPANIHRVRGVGACRARPTQGLRQAVLSARATRASQGPMEGRALSVLQVLTCTKPLTYVIPKHVSMSLARALVEVARRRSRVIHREALQVGLWMEIRTLIIMMVHARTLAAYKTPGGGWTLEPRAIL